jgi:hypothetical protein
MTTTILFRGTKQEAINKVREFVRAMAGKGPSPAVEGLLLRLGTTLLGKIQESFVQKSEDGTDAMGVQWQPLSPVTLALRRKGTGPKLAARLKREIPKLSRTRQALIRSHYDRLYRLYRADKASDRASASSRKHARHLLELMKPALSPTRYKKLKGQLEKDLPNPRAKQTALLGAFALILRDTGRLLNSLSPQIASPDRILRFMPGAVAVGSNVSYLKYHQSDKARQKKKDGTDKLPRRQILPDKAKPIPASWWKALSESLGRGLKEPATMLAILGPNARITA